MKTNYRIKKGQKKKSKKASHRQWISQAKPETHVTKQFRKM